MTEASDDEKGKAFIIVELHSLMNLISCSLAARGPVSPLAWLCDFTATNNNRKTPTGKITSSTRSVDSQRDSKDMQMRLAQDKQRQQGDYRSQQALYHSFFAESDEEAQAAGPLSDNMSYTAASHTLSPQAMQPPPSQH
ncbi:hypothetical protein EON64_20340, partial [archaeon]